MAGQKGDVVKTLKIISLLVVTLLISISGCANKTADATVQEQQERSQKKLVRQVGMPNITRFTEARRLRFLYELRDKPDLTCWIYARDMNGKMHLIGVSLGFPIPAGTQFSSPQKIVNQAGSLQATLPQAEPNGVFPPSTAEATWVIILTRNGPKAYYGETRLEALPERLLNADESQAIWPDGKPMPADVTLPPIAAEKDFRAAESK